MVLFEAVCAVAYAGGPAVRLVVSDNNVFASDTAGYLQTQLERSIPGIALERVSATSLPTGPSPGSPHLVVTLGDAAWLMASSIYPKDSAVLAVMPRRNAYEALMRRSPRNASAIFLDQPVGRMLNLVSLLRPHDARVGVVLGPSTQEMASMLQEVSSERKQRSHIETVSEEAAVGRAFARVVQDANMVIAIPDPVVHTANTVQAILLMSYQAGIPVIGYSAAYQRSGAMVSLYATPEQVARQAADAVTAWYRGKGLPPTQGARYFTIGINVTVAHSLGIELPDADILEQKLSTMKE